MAHKDLYAYSGGILQSVAGSLQALSENSAALLTLIGGRLYYFIVSSWGLGGAGVIFAVIALVSFIRCKRRNEEQYYDNRFVSMGVLCTLMLIFAVPLDAFLKADCDISTQDTVFGAASVLP